MVFIFLGILTISSFWDARNGASLARQSWHNLRPYRYILPFFSGYVKDKIWYFVIFLFLRTMACLTSHKETASCPIS